MAVEVGAERYVKSKPSVTINVTARIIAFVQFMEDILKPLKLSVECIMTKQLL